MVFLIYSGRNYCGRGKFSILIFQLKYLYILKYLNMKKCFLGAWSVWLNGISPKREVAENFKFDIKSWWYNCHQIQNRFLTGNTNSLRFFLHFSTFPTKWTNDFIKNLYIANKHKGTSLLFEEKLFGEFFGQ